MPGEPSIVAAMQGRELSDIRQRFEQTLTMLTSNPELKQGITEATAKHMAQQNTG